MTDEQWERIETLTGRPNPRGAERIYEMGEVLNAILYLTKTAASGA